MTTWSDWMVGVFKLRHPHVYGIDDVGQMLFGRIGAEVFSVAFSLYFIFVGGSAILSISIAFNALSSHAICTAIFVAIAAIITFIISSIQTLGRISWLAWVGTACIIVAVFTVTIAVGIQGHPPAVNGIIIPSDYHLFNNPSFSDAVSATANIVFAYGGTSGFFNIVSEMREPHLYPRALAICQTVVTLAYIVVGIVVYYYCGSHVASPALGSAGPIVKKVSYGIALPGLIMSSVVLLHLPAKHIFMRLLRGSPHLTSHTPTHWIAWLGSTFTVSAIAYIIASGIPVFDSLVSLTGALLGTFLTFQPMGCMWLYDNWTVGPEERTLRWRFMVGWNSSSSGVWSCAGN
ncbi:hypothetical protein BO71DRAFT_420524 [Aspergillus ellipticus CBS 707.79]|uniref:Amino acid transporter transmembrane domain-containing protein n=1 Tax=Aspergillus ellipticus CBS 707.79 TaxID=1448320 RepID=A0A319D6I9_9EURO|nr:hypothetical protein BO71DRAFT_420524 [Aspergillus ellipticus CBS 707.79]